MTQRRPGSSSTTQISDMFALMILFQWQQYGEDSLARRTRALDEAAMTVDQFLGDGEPEAGAAGLAAHQRREDTRQELRRDAGPVVHDVHACHQAVTLLADGELAHYAGTEGDLAALVQRFACVAGDVEQDLHDLVAVQLELRQTRVIVALQPERGGRIRLREPRHVLHQFVDVDGSELRG